MNIHIVAATLEDVPALAALHVESWREAYKNILTPEYLFNLSPAKRAEEWRAAIEQINQGKKIKRILLAYNENRALIGFCSAAESGGHDHDCELETIYVNKRFQRQGIGLALLMKIINWLIGEGFKSMICWVFADHAISRKFYESIGGELRSESLNLEFDGKEYPVISYRWRLSQMAKKLEAKNKLACACS